MGWIRGAAAGICLVLAASCGDGGYTATLDTDLDTKPGVQMPEGEPPAELVIQDVVEGDGSTVTEGNVVTVHYVGVSWTEQAQFDSSWEGGEPVSFPLDGVIQGWRQGLLGMQVGGRRALIIPPDLAYGDDTLIFVIDLHDIG